MMKALVASTSFVAIGQAMGTLKEASELGISPADQYEFAAWASKYSKKYKDETEYVVRMKLWSEAKAVISILNREGESAKVTSSYKLNKLADRTDAEFDMYLGLDKDNGPR